MNHDRAARLTLPACVLALALPLLAACTTPAQLLMAAIPDGTLSIMLSHFESAPSANRQRVAELEQRGDWPGLAQFAEDNLAKDRSNAAWWMVAGYAYSQQKQHGRAIQSFQEMVRLEPDTADGWNLLAQEYRAIGEPQRAVALLNNALLAVRDSPPMMYLLGESYADLNRYELAAKAYQQTIQMDNGFVRAWAGLARSYVRLGRLSEARDIARSLEKSQPELAAAIEREAAGATQR